MIHKKELISELKKNIVIWREYKAKILEIKEKISKKQMIKKKSHQKKKMNQMMILIVKIQKMK